LKNVFKRGKVDTTLFRKNDIIFGATNEMLCEYFSKLMYTEFEMSMMGELKFFLGLQIKQTPQGIYIHQTKYVKELLKKFNMSDAKEMKTLMNPTTYLGLDEESTKVDGTQYKAMVVLTHWQVHQIVPSSKVKWKSE